MAADIEFNVRNGMTVGASKYMVLDVNGALSARGLTLVSGQILSGGNDVLQVVDQQLVQPVDNKANTMGAASADWNNTYTTVNSKSGYWETAFMWGDHSAENYATNADIQTAISDLISGAPTALDTLNELASALGDDADFATNVTNSIATKWTQDDDKISNWDSAYGWGNHATQNYLTDYTVTVHDVTGHEGSIEISESQITDLQSYLTEYTVTVHDVTGHEGSIEISESQITDLQSYLLASDIASADNWSLAYTSLTANSANWDSAYSWGDHAAQNYLTDYTVTVHDVTGHEGSIEISESQITDLGSYINTTHAANDVTSDKITNWDNTYNTVQNTSGTWLTSYTETDPVFVQHDAYNVTSEKITNWDNTRTNVNTYSADWNNTYTSVNSLSDSWTGGTGGITDINSATDTDITSPVRGELLVYQSSTSKWTNKTDRAGLEEMYNYANTNFYNELSYSSTDSTVLTGVDVYVSSAKATHLFSREFIYSTTGTLTGVITTDEQNNNTLTKNMYYHTTTGALTSVTRSYT